MKTGEKAKASYQRQLEALDKLSQAILSNTDLAKIEKLLVKEIKSILGAAGCILFSPDGHGYLVPKALSRPSDEALKRMRLRLGEGISGKAWQTKCPLYHNNILQARALHGRIHPTTLRLNISKLLSIPLLTDGRPVGVLSVGRTPEQPDFTELDAEVLTSFGNQAAIAIKNASTHEALRWEREALRESEEKYRRVFEDSLIGLYRTTPEGRILMANPALLNMLGYSCLDELSKRNLENSGYEPRYPRSVFIDRIESKGEVIGLESAWIRADGSTLYVRENARAIRDDDGKTLYYEGTVENMTAQKLLNEISKIVNSSLDLDEVLTSVMRETCQALGFQMAAVYLCNRATRKLELSATYNAPQAVVEKLRKSPVHIQQSLVGRSFKSGKIISYDKLSPKEKRRAGEGFTDQRLCALTCIPVTTKEEKIGVLSLVSRRQVNLDPVLESLASAIGNQVGIAIENVRLYDDAKQQAKKLAALNRRLSTLLSISRAALESVDLDSFLDKVTGLVAPVFQADRCCISLLEEPGDFAVVKALHCKQPHPFPAIGERIRLADFPRLSATCHQGEVVFLPSKAPGRTTTSEQSYLCRAGIKSGIAVPLRTERPVRGVFTISHTQSEHKYSQEDIDFLAAITNQVAAAINKYELAREVEEKRRNLECLSSEMIRLEEKERQSVAGELHDSIGQALTAMRLNLDFTEGLVPSKEKELKTRIRQISELMGQTIGEIRDIEQNLRPRVLDDLGLVPALRWLTKSFSQQVSIPLHFQPHGNTGRLTADLEITVYRITQEGLNNIAKHSKAKEAWVDLEVKHDLCSLQIKDDGVGLDSEKVLGSTDTRKGFGIFNIRERAALLGGKLEILSDKGKGTTLRVTIPIREGGSQ